MNGLGTDSIPYVHRKFRWVVTVQMIAPHHVTCWPFLLDRYYLYDFFRRKLLVILRESIALARELHTRNTNILCFWTPRKKHHACRIYTKLNFMTKKLLLIALHNHKFAEKNKRFHYFGQLFAYVKSLARVGNSLIDSQSLSSII